MGIPPEAAAAGRQLHAHVRPHILEENCLLSSRRDRMSVLASSTVLAVVQDNEGSIDELRVRSTNELHCFDDRNPSAVKHEPNDYGIRSRWVPSGRRPTGLKASPAFWRLIRDLLSWR